MSGYFIPHSPCLEPRGLGVTHPTWDSARDAIRQHLGAFMPVQVVTLTPEMCVRADRNPNFDAIIHGAAIVVADGVGVAWGERHLTRARIEKIPGIDLATWALEEVDRIGGRVFLLGAERDSVRTAAENVSTNYPRLSVVGHRDGYFTETEEVEVVRTIAATEPHLLLVGMGSPKQEVFIAGYLGRLGCAVAMGVGGTLDVWSGTVRRAPRFFRKTGIEWLYRTFTQPRARLKRTSTLWQFIRMVHLRAKDPPWILW